MWESPLDTPTVSQLTPPGVGAIAVLRLWGLSADERLDRVFQSVRGSTLAAAGGGSILYGRIHAGGRVIDDVLGCLVARAPVPVVELTCHGGIRVVERVIEVLQTCGFAFRSAAEGDDAASAATPIERPLLAALGRARTRRAVRFLAAQRARLAPSVGQLCSLVRDDPSAAHEALGKLTRYADSARRLIGGARIALAGPPNAGKSTLFNRLVGRSAAIASDVAGTTRDWVHTEIEIAGVAITLLDTAGIREEACAVEQAAIAAGSAAVRSADVVIAVFDGRSDGLAGQIERLRQHWPGKSVVACLNKSDLGPSPDPPGPASVPVMAVSAAAGDGLPDLVEAITRTLIEPGFEDDQPCLFDPDHIRTVHRALSDDSEPAQAARTLALALLGGDLR